MKIDIKNFKKNIMFFIVSIALLSAIVLLSAIFGSGGSSLDKEELNNEDVNIHGLVISEVMSSNNGVVIDEKGNFIPADKFMIIVARHLLPISENKRILYDVKCSKALVEEIEKLGGTAVISRTGNSYTKTGTRDNDCIFGGEFSGHVYFRDKFLGFDSGIYAGLRMVEILSKTDKTVSELLEGINHYYSTPEIKILSNTADKVPVEV